MRIPLLSALLLIAGSVSAQLPSNGLRVHLKADAGTSTTVENGAVTTWSDQSGNGFNATAPAGQPVYVSNAVNGQPALFFNGAQSLHIATTGALGLVNNDYEMFFVAKSSASGIQFLGSGAVGHHEAHLNGFGGLRYIPQPDVGINHGADQAYTDGTARVFGVRTTGADGVARVNGVDVGHSHNSRSTSDAMFRLGDRSTGGYPLVGHIAEVIIYNRVLSKIERNQVESYLAEKYGLIGALTTAPTVSLDAPSASQQLGHTFSGTVNPNGSATTYRFLYGTDEDNLTMSTEPKSVGSGTTAVSVNASIPGLSLSQTYHVALVAENASHAARTSTQEFTVTAPPTGTAVGSFPTTGLRVHLKADLGTSTTDENQAVNTWLDQSGNGFTAYAPAGQPTYISNSINGLPALHFNGAQVLHISNTGSLGLTNSDYEMFFVAKSSNSNIQFLSSGGLPEHEVHLNGAAGLRFIPRNPVFIDNGANQAFTDGTQRIFSVRATSTSGVARVNGVDASQATDTRSSVDAMFRLGMRSDGSYPLVGHMSEVLVYNRTLSANERTQVERYLADKYAISGGGLTTPTLVMNAPTTTQDLGVTFSGTVNPNGVATSYRFMYGTDPDNLTESTASVSAGSGTEPVNVSATLSGLSRYQTYYVKLVAENSAQVVETAVQSFDMSYVDVLNFGWSVAVVSGEPGTTTLRATAQLGVPSTAGSEYKIRFGSDETDYMSADDLSGTFNGSIELPNENLEFGQSYELVLIAKSPSGNLTYSDTLSAMYFGLPSVILASANPSPDGSVAITGSVNPNGAETAYSIHYGTDLQNLTETSLTSLGNGTTPVSINRTLESLTAGQTFYVVLYAENDNFTVESDTLTFSTRWASPVFASVDVDAQSGASFVGTVDPNGYETEYRFRYGTTSAMTSATEWTSADSGTEPVPAIVSDVAVALNADFQVVMEARVGNNILRTDTLSFNTYFVDMLDVELSLSDEGGVNVIRVSGSFDAAGSSEATYRVLYGTDSGNLVADETGFTAGDSTNPDNTTSFSRALDPSEALTPGTTYYVQVEALSASGRTSLSGIESLRFALRPVAILDSVTTSQDFTARLDGKINPNAGNVSYVVQFGTDRNNLNQTSAVRSIENTGMNPVAEWVTLSDLTPGAVYYATFAATTEGYATQRSDTLTVDMRYATVSYVNPDVVTPTSVLAYIGTNAHGSAKSGVIRYGTQADNLNLSVTDPTEITGGTLSARTIGITGLTPDASYFAQWVVEDLNGGPTTYSDVVEFNTTFPEVSIDSVLTIGERTLGVRATVNTKNQSITLRQSLRSIGGSFSTESTGTTVAASPTPVSVLLPLTGVSIDEAYELRLLASNSLSNEAISDTVAFDSYFVQFDAPSVAFAGADVAVRAELQAEPDLAYAYRVLQGTHPDTLASTGDFVTVNTSNRYTDIDVILDADAFTPDSTYYFAIEGRGASGWITRSDTLSLVFQATPFARTPAVDLSSTLAATASASVFPNGRTLDVQFLLGTSADSLVAVGTPTRLNGTDSVAVTRSLDNLIRFTDYHLALMFTEVGSGDTTRTDTLAFSTDYPGVSIYSSETYVASDSIGQPILGRIIGYVEHGGLESTAWITYRKEGGTLIQSTTPQPVEITEGDIGVVSIDFGPLDPNSAYRARLVVDNGIETTVTDSLWFETTFPRIDPAGIQVEADGNAYLTAQIQRRGSTGTYGMVYGTHPDSLINAMDTRIHHSDNDEEFSAQFNLYGLDVSKTYYGRYVITRGYDQRTYRSALFSWNFQFPSIDSSRTTPLQDLTAAVEATIDTKGNDVRFWVEFYNDETGSGTSDTLTVAGSDTPVTVNVTLPAVPRFSTTTLALAVQATGQSPVYADTTTVEFHFPELLTLAQFAPIIYNSNLIQVDLTYSNPGRATVLSGRYGYANHPDSLIYNAFSYTNNAQEGVINGSLTFGPVVRNDSVYFQSSLESDGFVTWSPIRSVYSIGHEIAIDDIEITATGDGLFQAVMSATIDPKGMNSIARGFIATSSDLSDATLLGEMTLTSTGTQPFVVTFDSLSIGQTYYAFIEAMETDTYSIFTASPVQTIAFATEPVATDLTLRPDPSMTAELTGTVYPIGQDLTVRIAYGTDRNALTQSTQAVSVSGDSTSVALSELLTGFTRFGSVYASVVIERDGEDPIRSDTLSATLAFPIVSIGTPSLDANGNVDVPLTLDNGGFDTAVLIRYGIGSDEIELETDMTVADGSTEPVELTVTIPAPGIGVDVRYQVVTDVDRLVSLSDTMTYRTPEPIADFERAFARPDYTALFEAQVNPNGVATQIRFEWGPFGNYLYTTDPIDIGNGTVPVDVSYTPSQSLFFNSDYVVRMRVMAANYEAVSDTLRFNSRFPGLFNISTAAYENGTGTVTVEVNPQGIGLLSRLVYGIQGQGFTDSTAVVTTAVSETPYVLDLPLNGLEPLTTYEVKIHIQDLNDLNKVVTTNTLTIQTPAGIPQIELFGVEIDPLEETHIAIGRVNPKGQSVTVNAVLDDPAYGQMTIPYDNGASITGTQWVDLTIPLVQSVDKRLAKGTADAQIQDLGTTFPTVVLEAEYESNGTGTEVNSNELPIGYQSDVYFVTSTADTDSGVGQHGTLRYAMTKLNERTSKSGGPRKALPGTDRITESLGASNSIHILEEGIIALTAPLPTVTSSMTIVGPGRDLLTIDAGDQFRPFTVGLDSLFRSGAETYLNFGLVDLTVANGFARGSDGVDGGGGGAGMGGALFVHSGEITIENVRFHSNSAVGGLGSALVGTGGKGGDAPGAGSGGAGADASGYAGNGGFGAGGGAAGGAGAVRSGAGNFGGGAGANSTAVAPSGFGNWQSASATHGANGTGMGGALFQRSGYLYLNNVEFTENTSQNIYLGKSMFLIGTQMSQSDVTINGDYFDPDSESGALSDVHIYADFSPNDAPMLAEATYLTPTTARLDIERGSGTHRLVLATTSDVMDEYDGMSDRWFEGHRFRASSEIGDPATELLPGIHAVYADTGSTVTVTGLELGTSYVFLIYEYFDTQQGDMIVAYNRREYYLDHTHVPGTPLFSETRGNALRFSGDDAITLGNATDDFLLDDHLTVALWMKPSSLSANSTLLRNGDRFVLGTTATGALYLVADNGTVRDSVSTAAGVISAGTWHHIGLVSDSLRHRLFVDGIVRADAVSAADAFDFGGPADVIAGEGFHGDIDELAIYRSVGSPVASIFRPMNSIITELPSGMVASFQFNETGIDSTMNSATSGWIPLGDADRFVTAGYVQYPDLSFLTETNETHLYGSNLTLQRVSEDDVPAPLDAVLLGQFLTTVTNAPDSLAMITSDRVYVLQLFDTTTDLLAMHVSLPNGFLSGSVTMSQFKLYHRPLRSSGAWSLVANAASFQQGGLIVFELSTTQSGEYIVARDIELNYQQTAGTAIRFDGSTSYVSFMNTTGLSALSSHTIQMWFKTDDATRAVQFLTSKGLEFMELHLSGANRSLRFIPRGGAYFDTPENSIESNVWTHLSATFDVAGSSVKVYLNGMEVPVTSSGYASWNPFAGTYTTSNSLTIGQRTGGGYPFLGDIDEVRIWNGPRTALQVWDDMNGTTPAVYQPDLVLYAQMNDGAGSLVSDSGQGAFGTRVNFFDDSSWVTSTIPVNANAVYSTRLTGQAGWRLLSAPVQTTVGELLDGVWTQGFEGSDAPAGSPNVFTWNAAAAGNSASNWIPASGASQTLAPGQGVFVYVYATDPNGQGGFPKTIQVTGQAATAAPSLSGRLNPNADGWALVGNPLTTDIVWGDLTRSGVYNVPYLWDANADEWITWNGSTGALTDGRIGAFNAFFVATLSENPSLTVPFSARRAGTSQFVGKVVEAQAAASFSLKLESPDGRSNRAWFSFDTNGKLGLDEHDAFKLAPYSPQYVQLASVVQDSIRLDINHLPMLTDELSIPLRVSATASGTYRLTLNGNALPQGWDYAVLDTETGASTRLDEPLAFSWTGGSELDRFVLKISPKTITSTEPVDDRPLAFGLDQNYPNPFNPNTVIGFQLSVVGNTSLKVYDVLGREVAVLVDGVMPAGRHSVTFDGQSLASGVYMYRLQSGDQVLTRKFTLLK